MLPPMPAFGNFASLRELGHGCECSVFVTMCLVSSRLNWGSGCGDVEEVGSPVVSGFWAEGVPVPLCHTALWAGAACKLTGCQQVRLCNYGRRVGSGADPGPGGSHFRGGEWTICQGFRGG